MRSGLILILAALLAAGCGKAAPTLAGGKPVGHWVESLRAPDPRLRREAAFKLGNVGPADPAALPALTAALRDRDAAVRREAILALLKCGPEAREAVPTLAELRQHDPDAQVRACAARAVDRLRGASPGTAGSG
jgi:HEAT repeat protein